MGCAQTRDKSTEEEIGTFEKKLQFSNYSISQIKQAFFHANGSNSVSHAQLARVIEGLGIKYDKEGEEHYNNFISAFVSFEEEGENYYELTELLISIYLLSKSSQTEKASALFDIYNDEAKEKLSRIELERVLVRIIEVVFTYSEKLLDNDEGLVQLHSKIVETKEEDILPKVYAFFFSESDDLSKAQFIKLVEKFSNQPDMINFTSPQSIRKAVMDFVNFPKKTQVELQQHYKIDRRMRNEGAFEDEIDARTNDSSPHLGPIDYEFPSRFSLDAKKKVSME
jgi:hypothetical protein